MYTIVNLYSDKKGEITGFLKKFYNKKKPKNKQRQG